MRALVYTRVSADPHGNLRSVEDQEAECRAWCKRQGWEIVRTYRDNNRSASRFAKRERMQYQQLLADIPTGIADALVMWEGSRSTRDLRDFAVLRDLCAAESVLYCYSGRVYDMTRTDDRFTTALDAVLSEREASVTRDRVLRGVRRKAYDGRPHGRLLFGYAREYDPVTKELIRQYIVEERAEVVREAASRAAHGEPCLSIARNFNSRGLPSPSGKGWSLEQVKRVVINPAYAGKVVHRGEIIEATAQWPAIVDEATWAACVSRLTDPRRRTVRDVRVKYLLTGAAVCGVCGAPLRVQKNRAHRAYLCSASFHVSLKVENLEGYVTDVILERLSRPDIVELLQRPDSAGNAAAARAEAAELRARLNTFYASAAEGKVSADGLARIEQQLMPQIEAAERRAIEAVTPPLLRDTAGPDVRQRWEALSIGQRRELVSLLAEVRLNPMPVRTRTFDPARIEIIWRGEAASQA